MVSKKAKADGADLANLILQSQAAQILGITRAGVSWLVTNKRLRSEEVMGRKFVFRDEVLAYKAERAKAKGKGKK